MTNKEAIKEITKMAFQIFVESKVMANQNTKDKHEALVLAVNALEKQIPKKPYKRKEHKSKDYYCAICERCLGNEIELRFACLQPEYCEHCGQALDWSD